MLALDDNDLQVEIAKRLVGAEEVRERIDSLLAHRTFDEETVIYQKKSRVKTAKSIFEKIQDRRVNYPERGYGLGDVGDIVGFRLITLYDDSLFALFEELMTVVEQGVLIKNPVFKEARYAGLISLPHTFNDCCVFAQNNSNDNPYITCHSQIKNKFDLKGDALVRREIRKNGYSSIHIQLDGLFYRERHTLSVPVEFQLRTALEDTWAEISHQLEYKKRYDRLNDRSDWKTSISIASQHLKTFKKTIDFATAQATEIREAYKKIDEAIAPILRDRQFIIERPVALALIEDRCAVRFVEEAATAADELHVLLNRLARLRRDVEKEGEPRATSSDVELDPLKPKFEQDPRWRHAQRNFKDLEEYFDQNVHEPDKKALIKSLLELERGLFSMRILTCRVAQLRYEKKPQAQIADELGELQRRFDDIKLLAKGKDSTFKLIGAAAGVLAARYLKNQRLLRGYASRAFRLALKGSKTTSSAEIVKVAQTTLCLNALAHHLARNSEKAAQLRGEAMRSGGPDRSRFIELTLENLAHALLILTEFYDPKLAHSLYFDTIISVGNNVLAFVVDLHDVGVDDKNIADRISSQQISNITEMMAKYDVEPGFRGHRLHTLCGVYRVLKRREQWKRAVRELHEHVEKEKGKLAPELETTFKEELARAYSE